MTPSSSSSTVRASGLPCGSREPRSDLPQAFIAAIGKHRRPPRRAVAAARSTLPSVESSQLHEGRTTHRHDPFGARASLGPSLPDHYRLSALEGRIDLQRAPMTLKVLLENVLRHAGGGVVEPEDVERLASWRPAAGGEAEIPFMPARVILQDFTGVPAVVDLAAMRDAM